FWRGAPAVLDEQIEVVTDVLFIRDASEVRRVGDAGEEVGDAAAGVGKSDLAGEDTVEIEHAAALIVVDMVLEQLGRAAYAGLQGVSAADSGEAVRDLVLIYELEERTTRGGPESGEAGNGHGGQPAHRRSRIRERYAELRIKIGFGLRRDTEAGIAHVP